MQLPVVFDVSGQAVLGIFHIPRSPLPTAPVLLMCYGFNGNRCEEHRMSVLLGQRCEEAGIYMLRFDYRGQGVSAGRTWEISLASRVQDVLQAIKYVDGCFGTEEHQIVVLGFSDGARIASTVARNEPEVDGVILWNPIFGTNPVESQYARKSSKGKIVREPETGQMVFPLYGLWVSTNYLRELANQSSYNDFLTSTCQKLCIFGLADIYTEKIRNELLVAMNPSIEIQLIEEAEHLFGSTTLAETVMTRTIHWIQSLA